MSEEHTPTPGILCSRQEFYHCCTYRTQPTGTSIVSAILLRAEKKEWDTGKNNGDFQIFVGFFLHIWKSLRTGGCVSKKFPQSSTASFNFLLSFPMFDMVLNLFLQTFSIFISVSPCFSAFVKYVKKETLHIPKMGNKIIPLKKRKMFTLKNLIKKFYFSKFQSIYSRHRRLKIKMKK